MNSMLAHALAVVECARSLDLKESQTVKGVYKIGCEQRSMGSVLRELARSIEAMDRAAAASAAPEAVLGAVMRYVVDRGIDPAGITAHLRRMPAPTDAPVLDEAIALNDAPELRPLPGEIGAPDRPAVETVGQANIRTRAGGQDVAPKFGHSDALRRQFGLDEVNAVELGGDDARSLAAVSAMLRPKTKDGTTAPRAPTPSLRSVRDSEAVDKREMSKGLSTQLDVIGARLDRVVAAAGASPRIRGIMADFSRIRERLVVDATGGEVEFEVNPAMMLAVMRVANEVSDMERDLAFEHGRDPTEAMPAP